MIIHHAAAALLTNRCQKAPTCHAGTLRTTDQAVPDEAMPGVVTVDLAAEETVPA